MKVDNFYLNIVINDEVLCAIVIFLCQLQRFVDLFVTGIFETWSDMLYVRVSSLLLLNSTSFHALLFGSEFQHLCRHLIFSFFQRTKHFTVPWSRKIVMFFYKALWSWNFLLPVMVVQSFTKKSIFLIFLAYCTIVIKL